MKNFHPLKTSGNRFSPWAAARCFQDGGLALTLRAGSRSVSVHFNQYH
jgi:hypothetical protein